MNEIPVADILRLFDHTRFHPGARLFTWHPRGELTDAVADAIVAVIETEELFNERPFHRYADFSELTRIRLTIGHVFKIADRRRDVVQPAKSAFFSSTVAGFGIARMYEALMEDASIQVRTFRERAAAAEWLEVPLALLDPE